VTLIYHITTRDAAHLARLTGEYRADSLSEVGFIHLSQRHQVLGVANAFYLGQPDLVILVVDPARLQAELKYEAPAHPAASDSAPTAENRFPHLYGPLNFDAVVSVIDFPASADGKFAMPVEISNEK
jgi:uncharacterized protein (DUF952 family)